MRTDPRYRCRLFLIAAGLVFAPALFVARSTAAQPGQAVAPENLAAAMAQYRNALAVYEKAHAGYAAAASDYWHEVAAKRQLRNAKRAHSEALSIDDYVLAQPPIYTGPPKPQNPIQPQVPPRPVYVPVVADFLSAAEREFRFNPRMPQSDDEFKRAYARVALAAGLTKDQIVRIYSFEATGNGNYERRGWS